MCVCVCERGITGTESVSVECHTGDSSSSEGEEPVMPLPSLNSRRVFLELANERTQYECVLEPVMEGKADSAKGDIIFAMAQIEDP